MKFGPGGWRGRGSSHENHHGPGHAYAKRTTTIVGAKAADPRPLSLHYHDLARWLFITLAFAGLLSTGWFGIPLVPQYFVANQVNIVAELFVLFSALGTIWGVMAYREFTRSAAVIIEARLAARSLDPMIGEYEYRSYNPTTREYETGFVPSGPIDFWDKETQVPSWMDKGKYWHILLSLDAGSRDVRVQVVKDSDLPFSTGTRNAAVTIRKRAVEGIEVDSAASEEGSTVAAAAAAAGGRKSRRHVYIVKVPQWLVMNTERNRFEGLGLTDAQLSGLIADLNKKIVSATDEVAGWEAQRIRYHWKVMTVGIYLNKSLPLRLVYRQVIRNFPGAKRRKVDDTNANLANVKDDELIEAIMELAADRGIPAERIERLRMLVRFLKNVYTRQGLGEGASEYHSFHHSLEVSYMALHMLPRSLQNYTFGPHDYEMMLVAGLIHDYDPSQISSAGGQQDQGQGHAHGIPKGPSVARTMQEIERSRILDAYFSMTLDEFQSYFREHHPSSAMAPPSEYSTTHPEQVKAEWSPTEAVAVQALIWRTDFPFSKQKRAQEMFDLLRMQLGTRGVDGDRITLIAQVLWLADLAVTYMGSDPVRAWDRVTNLYDELNLPKLEAVSRTDAFFNDFADNDIFKQIIATKQFPAVFRQRWNLIYQFFHEGNPSTQINRTIETARKLYLKVNMELGLRRGEMLRKIAADNWGEYFIGIGKDQNEVFKAKSRFAELDPQNASAFWGDTARLLPAITDGSIDNFIMVLPEHSAPLSTPEDKAAFRSMLSVMRKKLVHGGEAKVLTDMEGDSAAFKEFVQAANDAGFEVGQGYGKSYFPDGWRDPEFRKGSKPRVVALSRK